MQMTRLHNITQVAKSVYLLILCDLVVDRLSDSEGYEIVIEALGKCQEWVQIKNIEDNQKQLDVLKIKQLVKECRL